MEEDRQIREKIDPKIIVALISGLVSIVSAAIPLLNSAERNFVLVSAAFLIALVLMAICIFILFRKRLYVGIAVLLLLAGVALSTLLAKQVVPASAVLTYADTTVSVYAGNGERVYEDGDLPECSFVSPACLSASGDSVYVADSDRVRRLENGQAFTEPFPASRYNALMVRNLESDLYVLAENREVENDKYYTFFLRIRNHEAEVVSGRLDVGAFSATVPDFAFSRGGVLWFIRLYDAPGSANATLQKLSYDRDADRYGPPEWAKDFDYSVDDMRESRMAFDADDNLYVSVPGKGIILRLGSGEQEFRVFAGKEAEHTFNDQGQATFSYPTALLPENGRLYVLDNGTVRALAVDGDRATACETLAGVTPEVLNSGKVNIRTLEPGETVAGVDFAFPAHVKGSLALDNRGRLLLSDPEDSFIYQIWQN
ncbi:MAG: hypothetical protein IKO14_07765 [Oscillibacter sp.]|nr:hypothetical protein [Oscillibacter sp.]